MDPRRTYLQTLLAAERARRHVAQMILSGSVIGGSRVTCDSAISGAPLFTSAAAAPNGRSLTSLQELMQRIRHHTISEQVGEINAALRGHYAYYGVAGNLRSLVKVYRVVERYWRRMLCSRSWAGRRLTWDAFNQIKERTPLLPPKLRLP